jgi:hypothetical protein
VFDGDPYFSLGYEIECFMEVLSAVLAVFHHLDATADEILERDRNRIGIDAHGDEPTVKPEALDIRLGDVFDFPWTVNGSYHSSSHLRPPAAFDVDQVTAGSRFFNDTRTSLAQWMRGD